MSEMQVSMRLSLQNLASGPLGEFADQIKALEPVIASLNAKFATFGRSLRAVGDNAGAGSAGMTRFESAVTAISEKLVALETKLGASVDGFAQFGMNAREAAAGVNEAGAAIGLATRRMDAAAVSTRAAREEMTGFGNAMKGMAEIWAGLKIEHGIRNTIHSASDFQQTLLRLQVRNIPQAEKDAIIARSKQESRQNPLFSFNDTLKANLASLPGLPGNSAYSQKMRADLMPLALQVASAAKYIGGDKSSVEHLVQNIFGVVDAMGGASNVDRARAVMGAIVQAINGGGGKVGMQSMETYLRMRNRAATTTMPIPEFIKEMAILEEFKAAGGGGAGGNTRGATLLNAIQQLSYGGLISKAGANLLSQMGIVSPKSITQYGHSSTQAVLAPGAILDSAMAQHSTANWVQDVMVPRMLKYTQKNWKSFGYKSGSAADLNNITEAGNALAIAAGYLSKLRVGGMTLGSGISMLGNPASGAAINEDAAQMEHSKNAAQTQAAIQKTYAANMGAFHKQVQSLSTALGVTVIPALTKLAHWLTEAVTWLAKFARNHRVISFFTELGGALGVLILAVKGFGHMIFGVNVKVFGALRSLASGIWTGAKGVWNFGNAAIGAAKNLYTGIEDALRIAGTSLGEVASVIVRRVFLPAYLLLHAGTLNSGENAGLQSKRAKAKALVNDGYTPWGAKLPAGQHWSAPGAKGSGVEASPEQTYFASIQKAMAQVHIPGGNPLDLGGVAAGSGMHHARKVAHHLSPQQMAAGWGLQDLHRAGTEANRQAAQWDRQVSQAKNAVTSIGAKDTPAGVRAKWGQYASILSAAGSPALAAQAQAHGDKLAKQLQLKDAKSTLSGLQSDLSNQTKLNAAQVTAGVLTPDQAQAKTLADQRAAAPALLAAAQAVKRYEQALGQSTTAIDTTITKIKDLGQGLTQLQQKISNGAQGALQGFFSAFMTGNKTWKQMGDQFVTSLLKSMNSAVSQNLSQGLIQGLFGPSTGAGKALRGFSGSGGAMSSIGSWIGNLFSGSSSAAGGAAASATAGGGWMSAIGGWLSTIGSSFASGIDTVPHDMVAQIHKGEMIVPASGAEAIRSGALGGSKQVHLTVHAMDSQSVMQALHGVAREASSLFGATNQNLNLGY